MASGGYYSDRAQGEFEAWMDGLFIGTDVPLTETDKLVMILCQIAAEAGLEFCTAKMLKALAYQCIEASSEELLDKRDIDSLSEKTIRITMDRLSQIAFSIQNQDETPIIEYISGILLPWEKDTLETGEPAYKITQHLPMQTYLANMLYICTQIAETCDEEPSETTEDDTDGEKE